LFPFLVYCSMHCITFVQLANCGGFYFFCLRCKDYDTLDIWSTTPHATDNKTAPNTVELPTDMSTQNVAHHNNNDDVQICNNTLEATVANAVANGEAKKEKDDESQ
jgi:hypothetical protein